MKQTALKKRNSPNIYIRRTMLGAAIVLPTTSFTNTILAQNVNDVNPSDMLPNIVFFMADDMGIGDLGCYGSTLIETPNIDSLCNSSLQFTHHYSGSTVSAPSRCCLMTGKHTGHSYIRANKSVMIDDGKYDLPIPDEEYTVAEMLKDKGYATMCVGKWGLGGPGTSGSPLNQGFDYFFGYLSQWAAHRYYPGYLFENENKVLLDGKQYSHAMIIEKGLKFIDQNSDKPFFAYFAVTPPHADLDIPDISNYENKFEETPFVNPKFPKLGFKDQKAPKATYAAMVSELDKNVGQILELLEKKGIRENTIFIFTSDNGVHLVGGHDPEFFNSNGPFRGYKRDLYEGGVRTPFILSWPAVIKEKRTTDHISAFWDFLPTIADITGADRGPSTDGISYLHTLLGQESKQKQHEYIYYEYYEKVIKQSILKDGWKLVVYNAADPAARIEELYYLPNDIGETTDIAEYHPEKVMELIQLMHSARTQSNVFKWEPPKKKRSLSEK